MITVALIGNPNVGKSVIFNSLVPGARQHTGNWPGKTVEKKEGKFTHKGETITLVDLPGTYSLTARAEDELIARNYIIEEKPDVVVDIVDASNIERNMYLTMLLKELEANLVVALNMMDIAKEKGYTIDSKSLSKEIGVPVVETVATKKEGMDELKDMILKAAKNKKPQPIKYREEVEAVIAEVAQQVEAEASLKAYPTRWSAIKILENDEIIMEKIKGTELENSPVSIEMSIIKNLGDDPEIILADERYTVISEIMQKSLKRGKRKWTTSDMLDEVFLDKWLGIPIFLSFMWVLFALSAETAGVYMTIVEEFFGWFGGLFVGVGGEFISSLIVDGIIGGLGGVLVFVPPIFTTFLGISLLEDSGYLARAAFVMDRLMVKMGLHGRSFIPMLLGFGCTVPAIMACRSIEGEEDRLITMLVSPFMSCGARLPVYILVAGAFWTGAQAGNIIWSIYLIGMVLAILVAYVFRQTLFKGEPSPFIMELPSYKIPTVNQSIMHMWERGRGFLAKAGTLLFVAAVAIWFLVTFPYGAEIEQSYAGMIGHAVEPLLRPLGFDWRIGVSLIFGLLAKEVLVEAMGIIYAVESEAAIASVFAESFTAVQGYALMLFTLIYTPCVAVLAAIKGETGEWKWVVFSVIYQLVLAYMVSWLAVVIGGVIF